MELILINVKTDTMSSGEIIFLDNQNLLNYPNITISDTGATYNLTEWHVGMINMKISGAEDIITAENRENKRPTKIGDLPVTQYEKNGQEVQRIALRSVTVTPHGSYSLFSVTKRIKYGWELYGEITKLGIRKVKNKVEFNIVINSPKGALLCTYLKRKTEKYEEKPLANAGENKSEENPPKVNKIYVALAHEIFDSMGEYLTRATAKYLWYKLTM